MMKHTKTTKQAQDLTLVLLHANGIPRTFRIRIPSLKRNLLMTALSFILLVLLTLVFSTLWFTSGKKATLELPSVTLPSINLPSASAPSAAPANDNDLQTVSGLREELAKVQASLEQRKNLGDTPNLEGLNTSPMTLLGPRAVPAAPADATLKINNPKVIKDPVTKVVRLQFEIQNTTPSDKQTRGHILVLAKTPGAVFTYPAGAFAPSDNILINFAKGETFGVARLRPSVAEFKNIPVELYPQLRFQILLMSTDGKILATAHFEDKK